MSSVTIDKSQLTAFSSVVSAALRSGLLDAVTVEPAPVEAIAARAGTDPRYSRLVLEALTAFGIFRRGDGGYSASPGLRAWAAATPGGLAAESVVWGLLPSALTTGTVPAAIDEGSAARAKMYQGLVSGLAKMWEPSAEALATLVPDTGPNVLDVGCGSGVWSLALASHRPGLRVIGADLPEVLPAFDERARALGLTDRAQTRAVDLHVAVPPTGRFDLVVVANVLRLEPPETAQALLSRLRLAIAPGGALLIVDAFAQGTEEHERWRALYALHLAMRTERGEVHPPERVTAWLEALGARDVKLLTLPPAPGAIGALFARFP
jgi:SAM-dependent methyltransferase